MTEPFIPIGKLLKLVEKTIRFPNSQICKHLVAADMLSLIEECGGTVSHELAKAVVNADDDEALALLERS